MSSTPAMKYANMETCRRTRLCAKAALAVILTSALGAGGCVKKSDYDRDIGSLAMQLQTERAERASIVAALETKLQGRAKSLSELTDRYMAIEKELAASRQWRKGFKDEILTLDKDVSELKLTITENTGSMRGDISNELLIKVIDMDYRIKTLLDIYQRDAQRESGQ